MVLFAQQVGLHSEKNVDDMQMGTMIPRVSHPVKISKGSHLETEIKFRPCLCYPILFSMYLVIADIPNILELSACGVNLPVLTG